MIPLIQLVLFTLDGQTFALELASVYRVVRALEVTPLPNAPAVILGVVNVQGEIASVVSLRHRFRLPKREITPSDQFILVSSTTSADLPIPGPTQSATQSPANTRTLALVVDSVAGIITVQKESIAVGEEIVPSLEYVQGVAKLADGLILIHNLERCLSLHEEQMLDNALAGMGN
jgi:purine-binding chemotaxis protein CheW